MLLHVVEAEVLVAIAFGSVTKVLALSASVAVSLMSDHALDGLRILEGALVAVSVNAFDHQSLVEDELDIAIELCALLDFLEYGHLLNDCIFGLVLERLCELEVVRLGDAVQFSIHFCLLFRMNGGELLVQRNQRCSTPVARWILVQNDRRVLVQVLVRARPTQQGPALWTLHHV